MPSFDVLEPAIDPNNRITFLLDWELTMKCNLDCSYCATGLHGGHDNSSPHPPIDKCLDAIDFMFEYADQYMKYKPKGIKYVVLNVYGGEALHHPDIIEILENAHRKYQPYKDRWNLTVTTTTNAVVSDRRMEKIIPYIDEFTASYHPESTDKQKQQFKKNILAMKAAGKRIKVVVLMHDNDHYFLDSENLIDWLEENQIKVLPRQLDSPSGPVESDPEHLERGVPERKYKEHQIQWFNSLYKDKTFGNYIPIENTNFVDSGRACCGGRQLCENQNFKERKFYVQDNRFTDWYCSVNWFFLFVKQRNGDIYVNKDCKMNFNGNIGPIGNLKNSQELLEQLTKQLATATLPVIQCQKQRCLCGLCSPKARELSTFKEIFKKYQKDY